MFISFFFRYDFVFLYLELNVLLYSLEHYFPLKIKDWGGGELPNFLSHIKNNSTVITCCDFCNILLTETPI